MSKQPASTGAIALVGSGEYTAAMNEVDQVLLHTLGGPADGRVALIPTASGLEPGQPARWNAMGQTHFQGLGALPTPISLITREDASQPDLVATLAQQTFFYFSGGSPDYLIETLNGTPAWHTMLDRAAQGAALAGCSAGAMMLGGCALSVRSLRNGEPPRWRSGLAVVPNVAVLPHYDRMRLFVSDRVFDIVLASVPPDVALLGIDEDTALVRLPGVRHWQVFGRQTVSVTQAGRTAVYVHGERVTLD